MSRIANILVPVDFSNASKAAMNFGAQLALQFQARLVVAHIVPSLAAILHSIPKDEFGLERQIFAETERQLPDEIPTSYRTRISTQSIVRAGDVRDELLSIVDSEKIDLIVMGAHGRRAVERLFMGSTAENMLRKTPVPIIIVPERSKEVSQSPVEAPFQRVIYATDLSDTADGGFRYCVDLVRSLGAQMTLLHVLDVNESVAFENKPEVRAQLQARMRKMIEGEDCIGLPLRTEIGDGTPYRRILKYAEETSADLLVINLQSNGKLEREFLGSTAERVIRSSSIPVLSIPCATSVHILRTSNVDTEVSSEMSKTKTA